MPELELPFIFTCKKLFVECECGRLEHLASFSYTPADWESIDKDPLRSSTQIYLDFHLYTWRSFFRRLWTGIKYVFGYRSRYGEWDEIMLSTMDVARLVAFLEQYLLDIDKDVVADA